MAVTLGGLDEYVDTVAASPQSSESANSQIFCLGTTAHTARLAMLSISGWPSAI